MSITEKLHEPTFAFEKFDLKIDLDGDVVSIDDAIPAKFYIITSSRRPIESIPRNILDKALQDASDRCREKRLLIHMRRISYTPMLSDVAGLVSRIYEVTSIIGESRNFKADITILDTPDGESLRVMKRAGTKFELHALFQEYNDKNGELEKLEIKELRVLRIEENNNDV